jgi:type II secretory pathway component GspD/PulD (secretin)
LPDTTHNIPNVVPATSSGIFWSDSRSDIGARIDNIVNASILDSPLDSSGGTSIQLQILDKISFEAIIHAVRKDSRRQVLTAPRIMCFNAQQASIFVGTQQTYIRSYNTGTGGVSKPVLDLVDGPTVVFDVRPVVSADRRYITLYLRPVITFEPILKAIPFRRGSDATGAPIVLQVFLPQLDRQELRTVVMVPDGGTVLIGGLKNADELYRRNEVPVLGKLPILGWFFRSEVEANSKKELLILVTAKIIAIDEQEADM